MKYVLAIITLTLMAFTLSLDVSAQNGPPAEFVDGVVLVKFLPGTANNNKIDAVDSVNGNSETEYKVVPGLQKITTNLDVEQAINILFNNPNVEYAEPDFIVTLDLSPNDPAFENESLWAMHNTGQSGGTVDADIDAPEAWDITTGDPYQIIAVIDTVLTLQI